ncbi:MAG: DUF262 domain-containing protein [Hyphomicrobiales bacterium]
MKGIQDTTTNTFRALLGNGIKYIIPKFQRDYSWNAEQWDDLWQDIQELLSSDESEDNGHYMGYLVLQSNDNKVYRIIDGQQRITTITIMILAAIKCLKDLSEKEKLSVEEQTANSERAEELIKRYIGVKDPVTLSYNNKLQLNRNNDAYYKDYLVKLDKLRQRGISASERLMKNCFEWFYPAIGKTYTNGVSIAEFIEAIVDKLYFTTIKVGDELNAFRVFETLNARGVQLSSSDLLKNYLFSLVDKESEHQGRIQDLELKWSELLSRLGKERLPDFLRYYWNSHNKTVRKTNLFKTIRNKVNNQSDVFNLMNELLEYADIYVALKNPSDEYWKEYNGKYNSIKEKLTVLSLFGVKQALSLLMIANSKLNTDEFIKVLRHAVVISFRHTIIGGLNANELESAYNTAALKIHNKGTYDHNMLRKVYVTDTDFETTFANKELKYTSRNKKIIRYILAAIEQQCDGNAIDIEDERNSVEHILPQNPKDNWDWDDSTIERSVNRIGNLALLESNQNQDIGNLNYSEKVKVFSNSNFVTTKEIAESYSEWTEKTINSRQVSLAKKAKTIWRIDFNIVF